MKAAMGNDPCGTATITDIARPTLGPRDLRVQPSPANLLDLPRQYRSPRGVGPGQSGELTETEPSRRSSGSRTSPEKPTRSPELNSVATAVPLADRRLDAMGMLVETTAALERALDAELRLTEGMSLSSYRVLVALANAPYKRLRLSELATEVSLTRGAITRVTDRLETLGFVRRAHHPTDRRGTYSQLTDAGRHALRRATRACLPRLERLLVQPMGEEGLAALVGPLRVIRDNLYQHNDTSSQLADGVQVGQ